MHPPKRRHTEYKKGILGLCNFGENVNVTFQFKEKLRSAISSGRNQEFYTSAFYLNKTYFIGPQYEKWLDYHILDLGRQRSLETQRLLNWWTDDLEDSSELVPLYTRGDGNCLLHAVSLSLWGIDDKFLDLRRQLFIFLKSQDFNGSFVRRWKLMYLKDGAELGLRLLKEQFEREWQDICNDCDEVVAKSFDGYKCLLDVHVFALANMLKRPIITISPSKVTTSHLQDQKIPFKGVFLPLCCPPEECSKDPILISYEEGHFTSLVPITKSPADHFKFAIPLFDVNKEYFNILFEVDPGLNFDWLFDDYVSLSASNSEDTMTTYFDTVISKYTKRCASITCIRTDHINDLHENYIKYITEYNLNVKESKSESAVSTNLSKFYGPSTSREVVRLERDPAAEMVLQLAKSTFYDILRAKPHNSPVTDSGDSTTEDVSTSKDNVAEDTGELKSEEKSLSEVQTISVILSKETLLTNPRVAFDAAFATIQLAYEEGNESFKDELKIFIQKLQDLQGI